MHDVKGVKGQLQTSGKRASSVALRRLFMKGIARNVLGLTYRLQPKKLKFTVLSAHRCNFSKHTLEYSNALVAVWTRQQRKLHVLDVSGIDTCTSITCRVSLLVKFAGSRNV